MSLTDVLGNFPLLEVKLCHQRGRDMGKWEEKRDGCCTPECFPAENPGAERNFRPEFLQQDLYLLSFGEKIWTMYLVVRLLDEGFHVVVLSEPLLCLGSAVYFEKRLLTVITWR